MSSLENKIGVRQCVAPCLITANLEKLNGYETGPILPRAGRGRLLLSNKGIENWNKEKGQATLAA